MREGVNNDNRSGRFRDLSRASRMRRNKRQGGEEADWQRARGGRASWPRVTKLRARTVVEKNPPWWDGFDETRQNARTLSAVRRLRMLRSAIRFQDLRESRTEIENDLHNANCKRDKWFHLLWYTEGQCQIKTNMSYLTIVCVYTFICKQEVVRETDAMCFLLICILEKNREYTIEKSAF